MKKIATLIKFPKGGLIIRLSFQWYDFWVGFYYDRMTGIVYFCPVPTIVFEFQWLYHTDRVVNLVKTL